jgi:hypothetical protein
MRPLSFAQLQRMVNDLRETVNGRTGLALPEQTGLIRRLLGDALGRQELDRISQQIRGTGYPGVVLPGEVTEPEAVPAVLVQETPRAPDSPEPSLPTPPRPAPDPFFVDDWQPTRRGNLFGG